MAPGACRSWLSLGGAEFGLLDCGALWWPEQRLLAAADLHLEKASSLAARGALLPPYDSRETLTRLGRAVATTGAETVLALGDSFHDAGGMGRLEPVARRLLAELGARTRLCFIAGNHDGAAGGMTDEVVVAGIAFRHIADRFLPAPEISGHFHPKVRLTAGGRRLSRRCFARLGDRLVLPAYGSLAGGLWVTDPAFVAALGGPPEALVPTGAGLLRLETEGLAA